MNLFDHRGRRPCGSDHTDPRRHFADRAQTWSIFQGPEVRQGLEWSVAELCERAELTILNEWQMRGYAVHCVIDTAVHKALHNIGTPLVGHEDRINSGELVEEKGCKARR